MSLAHVPVLLYHGVRDRPVPGLERWTVTPAAFGAHVAAIAASGRTPLTMSALAAALKGAAPLPEAPMAITFDDGWADTRPAVERLAARGIASTTYVQTGRLGEDDRLDRAGVRALDALGEAAEVGAHSVDHARLDGLTGIPLEREVAGSKAYLEELLGHAVEGFAYPYGAHDARSRAAVVAAGFEHAAAAKGALSHAGDDPYAIARWTVTADTTADQLALVLDGDEVPVVRASEKPPTLRDRVGGLVHRSGFGRLTRWGSQIPRAGK
ncbi:MAG TPA: polysaccharide deacetylase family protein [Baekduia sp.]|nr:polysaccharide deacetylase family protein [Baekduia sp.]